MKKREQTNPVHNDKTTRAGGLSASSNIATAGPTATSIEVLQLLSHSKGPLRISVVVDNEELARFDELCAEVGWSRSRMIRKSMRSLLDGQVILADIRPSEDRKR